MMRKYVTILTVALLVTAAASATYNAVVVVDYDAGINYSAGYTNPTAAIGAGPTDTGEFMGTVFYVNPFNAPYSTDDVVSIGAGGHITLQLDVFANALGDVAEIGIFSYQFFNQDGWPSGGTGTTAQTFRPAQFACIDVSNNGTDWVSLNAGQAIQCDVPANAFADEAGTVPSDYGMPFSGTISDFDGTASVQDTIDVYNGSAGGTWVDISSTGLDSVGYIRLSVATDATTSFELESISIANCAAGFATPEPTCLLMLALGSFFIRKR
jgi:hypothetical protein